MDKRFLSVMVICVALIAIACAGCTGSAPAASEKPVYKVGVDIPYPPFSELTTDGEYSGFDADSIRWIGEDQGFDVEFVTVAWDGIIPSLLAGNIDMIYSGMTITDERAEKVDFSIPYWTINQAVIAKKDSGYTIDNLNAGELVVGTQSGCTAAIWTEENLIATGILPEENLKLYPSIGNAADDVSTGRIDVAMYDDTVMKDVISDKDLEIIGYLDTNEEFGIAIRKNEADLLAKLNAGLTNLMADPYWEELKTKYEM